jgi:hypothetical protein
LAVTLRAPFVVSPDPERIPDMNPWQSLRSRKRLPNGPAILIIGGLSALLWAGIIWALMRIF